MAHKSAIEWTDSTWNPWHGCHKISAGCKNCYMFRDKKRYGREHNEMPAMKPETTKALFELVRLAIKHVTSEEPSGSIVVTLCGHHANRVENEYYRSRCASQSTSCKAALAAQTLA